MATQKKRKISSIGILACNVITINNDTIEWIDLKETNLAALAKAIGIDSEHQAKVNITIEIVEQACEQCGKLATGDQICQNCGKIICDECAIIDARGRYCPICFDLQKAQQENI